MRRIHARLGWTVAAVLALALLGAMAGIVRGGALDPPAPPSSTMKSLDDIPGSWDRKLAATGGCASERFVCVLDGHGVLDRETGIVWERQVDAQQTPSFWADALVACAAHTTGGRLGWRLPTDSELLSLIDADGALTLPAGNPFSFPAGASYWSSTTDTSNTSQAMRVSFSVGAIADSKAAGQWLVLCARSGESTGTP